MIDTETLPTPRNKATAARWAESAKRARILDGEWRQDAREYFASFYAEEVRTFLPPAQLGINPAASVWNQMSTAYDEDPEVTYPGIDPEALSLIVTEECWPQMVEALPRIFGLGDGAVYVTHRQGRGIVYQWIDPHHIEGDPDPIDPDQFARLRWYSPRTRESDGAQEWTRDVWDPTGKWGEPGVPLFRIEARRTMAQGAGTADGWVDVTEEYAPEAAGEYPRRNTAGEPLLPFIAFHSRISNRLWNGSRGIELVEGTYTTSALLTFWLMNVRDNSNPVRGIVDGEIDGAGQAAPTGGIAARYMVMHPGSTLMVRSRGERTAREFQWSPNSDPRTALEAAFLFIRELAVSYGISPSDLQITGGQSGYAIAISKEGQRKVQRRVVPALRRSDRLRLAMAAAIVNQATGSALPEDPGEYTIAYRGNEPTADERKAEADEAAQHREQGIITPVEHWQMVHPGDDDATAWAGLMAAKLQEGQLAEIASPTVRQFDTMTDEAPGDEGAT